MAKTFLFKLEFPGSNGKRVPVCLTVDGLRSAIAQILHAASSVELPADLERMITLNDNPILCNGLAITPLEDDPDGAHVSIGIGPIDLQFAVSRPILLEALADLTAAPQIKTSPHRVVEENGR
jgi:hypothetical protein